PRARLRRTTARGVQRDSCPPEPRLCTRSARRARFLDFPGAALAPPTAGPEGAQRGTGIGEGKDWLGRPPYAERGPISAVVEGPSLPEDSTVPERTFKGVRGPLPPPPSKKDLFS